MSTEPLLRCRCLLHTASWLVPAPERANWLAARLSILRNWTILIDRGEITLRAEPDIIRYCWRSFADAVHLWFNPAQFHNLLRRPSLVPLLGALLIAVSAFLSGGFRATHAFFHNIVTQPSSDSVVPYCILFTFSLLIAAFTIAQRRRALHWHSWSYSAFFAAKLAAVLSFVPAGWLEFHALILAHRPHAELPFILSALSSVVIYIVGLTSALRWCYIDQSLRCPVCLKLLNLPVAIGSWSSVFDPANTELVCDDGHGSLLIPEADPGADERWTTLDPSWRDVLEPAKSA